MATTATGTDAGTTAATIDATRASSTRSKREYGRELAKAEDKFLRERWEKGDEAWYELRKKRSELATKREKELRSLDRERYAGRDDDDD